MLDGPSLVHVQPGLEEGQERQPLAIGAAADERLVGSDGRRAHRTGCADRAAEVGPREITGDAFSGGEIERLALADRSANRAAELLTMEPIKRGPIRQLRRQALRAFEEEQVPSRGIGA